MLIISVEIMKTIDQRKMQKAIKKKKKKPQKGARGTEAIAKGLTEAVAKAITYHPLMYCFHYLYANYRHLLLS